MFEDLIDEENEISSDSSEDTQLKEPRSNPFLFGHDQAEKKILSFYNKDRMPHAIALTGPKGIGKATFAYRIAKFLFHDSAGAGQGDALFGGDELAAENLSIPQDSTAFLQVSSGGHPDCLTVEPAWDERKGEQKKALLVDDVKPVGRFLRSTSASGGWRICIVDEASSMNWAAQNALLKILEEPPARTLIILIAHNMGAFLPTIRSRIHVLNMDALNSNDFNDLLGLSDIEIEDKDLVFGIVKGAFGRIQEFAPDNVAQNLSMFFECINADLTLDHLAIMKLADKLMLKGNQTAYDFTQKIIETVTEEALIAKGKNQDIASSSMLSALKKYPDSDWLDTFFHKFDKKDLICIHDALKLHFRQSDTAYLDKKYIIHHAFEILTGENYV